jgi:hypothetical protein
LIRREHLECPLISPTHWKGDLPNDRHTLIDPIG